MLLAGTTHAAAAAAAVDPPPAGGLTALATEAARPVPLANAGFEDQLDGWRVGLPEAWSVAPGRTGQGALRLDCGKKTPFVPSVRQAVADVGPGVYRLRAWARADGVRSQAAGAAGARAGIEYVGATGQRAWESMPILSGTRDWEQQELLFLLPADMKPGSFAVTVGRYGSPTAGEALFDDLTLERLEPPAVETFLRYPNYRGYLPADGPQRVKLWVKVNQPNAGAVRVEAKAADGKTVASAELPTGTTEQVLELDATPWPAGRYLLTATARAYTSPAYAVQKIDRAQRDALPMWFDERQVLHTGGKPVFPIGLYNTNLKFGVLDEADLARLGKMAEAPVNFNINYFAWAHDTTTRRKYLAEMQKHGIFFLDTVNNVEANPKKAWDFPILNELMPEAGKRLGDQKTVDEYLTRLAGAMRGMPGHGGWYVMDERDFGEVPRHFHLLEVLRRADPGHPTFGVSNKPREFLRWRDTLDVFGLDPYPLFNMKAGRPLGEVAEWTRAGVEATQGSRPVWMVLQFFQGWSTDRWPTEDELRTMSLMAVAEGARGLFYWSFGNRALLQVKEGPQREEYWQRLVRVTKELKALEPALLAPDAPAAVKEVSDPRVRWRARLADGKCYVFAHLPAHKRPPDDTPAVAVKFTLADGTAVTKEIRPDVATWFAAP